MNPYLKGKRLIRIILVIIVLILAVPRLLTAFAPSDKWSITDDGMVSYPQNRGAVEYTRTVLNDTSEFTLSKIVYISKGEKIYSLLRVPKAKAGKKIPAIILLPGAQVTKEGMQDRATKLAEWGYVTLTIDERGNTGETRAAAVSMDEEYFAFVQNKEPVQHKIVFDVLRAFDFLRGQNYVGAKNIAVLGESMGGRYAIIAGAVEPRIKAVVAVSTSGYGSLDRQFPNDGVARFFRSIDPDAYIGKISPRKIIMTHADNDTVIPIDLAQTTFRHASEPKRFIVLNSGAHGWSQYAAPVIREELAEIFR